MAVATAIAFAVDRTARHVAAKVGGGPLPYTCSDPGDCPLMVGPNARVAPSICFNHSTGDRTAPATVSVWVPPASDLERARGVLEPAGAAEVTVAEMTPAGVRIELKGP